MPTNPYFWYLWVMSGAPGDDTGPTPPQPIDSGRLAWPGDVSIIWPTTITIEWPTG